ncbi:serine/threonine-protein kinase [Nonomuraea sp. NEAU-A123]|uniref:serine/threonine-protein kinase n=1 Tax=Nonomuraea sp. NEAU-A123 TaxID=2839649 RepID=UPI001BE49364|nr:serine/threonine-protein kinase [Nonomuraea sp. NEAU-A123]MBT2228931.1 serine/threonine protein kinase [Nonomuraea sp. NEAU-A123]
MQADFYLLAGRYRLVERLGEGGAGTVWRALDQTLDRQVAVKQMRLPAELTPRQRAEFADRAIHEARSAGRLRDPAIVLIHDVVLDGDQPWIVMDLVTGRSLDKVIKERGPLPPEAVARVGLQVLSALRVAHAHGILHQDVKPANIMLDADGSAMLTDFGIATPMGGRSDRQGTAGSPGYMAPERLNEHAAGPASDLWSLGASLYTAVEGRPPFERALPAAVAAAVLLHEPPFPARAGRELGGLLMAMLAKDPAARPTAEQIGERLSGAPAPRAGRRRWWLVPAALAAVAVVGTGGWYALAVLNGPKETGRFAAAPDPCGLIGDARAGQLLKGTVQRVRTRAGECVWQVRDGSQITRSITVRTRAEQPDGDYSGPAVARLRFDSEHGSRAAGKGTVFRKTTGALADVSGVGEAAFVQDSFEFYMTSGKSGRSDSTLLFRTSNLVGEVILHREDVPPSAPADRKTAIESARVVAATLNN